MPTLPPKRITATPAPAAAPAAAPDPAPAADPQPAAQEAAPAAAPAAAPTTLKPKKAPVKAPKAAKPPAAKKLLEVLDAMPRDEVYTVEELSHRALLNPLSITRYIRQSWFTPYREKVGRRHWWGSKAAISALKKEKERT